MVTLFFFVPLVVLFMAVNIIFGCYVTIRLGYGPPNWQTALNQVVPLTTLQDYLNESRGWIEKKAPKIENLLQRWHVPKPIIFIDTTVQEEEDEIDAEVPEEQTEEESADAPVEDVPNELESEQDTGAEFPAEYQEEIET